MALSTRTEQKVLSFQKCPHFPKITAPQRLCSSLVYKRFCPSKKCPFFSKCHHFSNMSLHFPKFSYFEKCCGPQKEFLLIIQKVLSVKKCPHFPKISPPISRNVLTLKNIETLPKVLCVLTLRKVLFTFLKYPHFPKYISTYFLKMSSP